MDHFDDEIVDFHDDELCPPSHAGRKPVDVSQWFGTGGLPQMPVYDLMCPSCERIHEELEMWEYSLICD